VFDPPVSVRNGDTFTMTYRVEVTESPLPNGMADVRFVEFIRGTVFSSGEGS
jgi:hypothetical protein